VLFLDTLIYIQWKNTCACILQRYCIFRSWIAERNESQLVLKAHPRANVNEYLLSD
jgi:hypothetical protein